VPAYVVQHFGGAMLDYQNGHMAGADNNVEKLTERRSMTVGVLPSSTPTNSTPADNLGVAACAGPLGGGSSCC
jgi:hypothetical protein